MPEKRDWEKLFDVGGTALNEASWPDGDLYLFDDREGREVDDDLCLRMHQQWRRLVFRG